MRLIEHHRAKPPLPEMAGAPLAGVDMPGIAPVHPGERPPQPIGVARHENQMDMVGHQHPGPHRDLDGAAGSRQEDAIERVIRLAEKVCARPLPRCVT